MELKKIPISTLVVNHKNDRHGELPTEREAISWLFHEREAHMKKLAKDIATEGEVYEAPLVYPTNNRRSFIVFDGNRRVACLKVLNNPDQAPTAPLREYFEALAQTASNGIPTSVECHIEADLDRIDEILYRRHTGSQGGVGRSPWDATAKQNFLNRSGKHAGVNLPELVEKLLRAEGHITDSERLPRSNLQRLLSSEEFRNKVGLSQSRGKLHFTHEKGKTLGALNEIARDLIDQKLVLGDIWNNEQKRRYLANLEAKGALPTARDKLANPLPVRRTDDKALPAARTTVAPAAATPPKRERRLTLIRQDIDYRVTWNSQTARLKDIWSELRDSLFLDRHLNSIAVLLRVLIELAVDNFCLRRPQANAHPNDTLAVKIEKSADSMRKLGGIDKKYEAELRKISHSDAIVSTNTMNRYVHSPSFAPSPEHLCAIWDIMQSFVVNCLNEHHDGGI